MKNKLLFSFLLLVVLFPGTISAQCLSAWLNYLPITISNPNAVTLTNFQVKLTVNTAAFIGAGQMLANGNDIRFVDASCNNIDYWIESGINTTTTSIWVKVPTLAASGNTTIDMYFNNPASSAAQNGDNVFLFFDDFSTASLDPAKWTIHGTPSTCSQSSGVLTFTGNYNWEYISSNTTWNGPVVIESRESTTGPSAALVLGYTGTDNRYTFRRNSTTKGTTYDNDVSGGNAWFNTAYPDVEQPDSVFSNYEIKTDLVSNTITLSSYCDKTTSNCNTNTTSLNQFTGSSYYVGYSSYATGYTLNSDWIFARSAVPLNPIPNYGTSQANVYITTSSLSGAYCAGSNVTVNFNTVGTYTSGNIFSAELSDASGSFISPVVIGTLTSSSNGPQSISSVIPVLTVSGTGYRIRVTSSAPFIAGTDNGNNIIINALPAVTATALSGTICDGESETLTAGGATNYAWNSGGNAATEIVSPTSTSTYTVTGTDANSCLNTATVSVIVNPLPVVDLGTDVTQCGGTVTLDAQNSGSTYMWNDNSIAQTLLVSASGNYFVAVTDANGCANADTISVTVNPLPVVDLGTDVIQCGGTVTLDAQNSGSTYLWNDNSTIQTLLVSASGNYFVAVTDANGCVNADTISVTINTLPTVTGTATTNSVCLDDAAVTLTGTPAGGTWSGPGITASSFLPSGAGTGTQTALYSYTDVNGCSETASVVITVNDCAGIVDQSMAAEVVKIYPNPNNGQFTIEMTNNESADVIIYNALGQSVQSFKLMPDMHTSVMINTDGIYFIAVTTASGKHQMLKILVSK